MVTQNINNPENQPPPVPRPRTPVPAPRPNTPPSPNLKTEENIDDLLNEILVNPENELRDENTQEVLFNNLDEATDNLEEEVKELEGVRKDEIHLGTAEKALIAEYLKNKDLSPEKKLEILELIKSGIENNKYSKDIKYLLTNIQKEIRTYHVNDDKIFAINERKVLGFKIGFGVYFLLIIALTIFSYADSGIDRNKCSDYDEDIQLETEMPLYFAIFLTFLLKVIFLILYLNFYKDNPIDNEKHFLIYFGIIIILLIGTNIYHGLEIFLFRKKCLTTSDFDDNNIPVNSKTNNLGIVNYTIFSVNLAILITFIVIWFLIKFNKLKIL